MNLFSNHMDEKINLLPKDGTVYYHGAVLSQPRANDYFTALMTNIDWKNDEAFMFGKHIITKRKVAWYASEGFSYTYSNKTKQALLWTNELLELKQLAEEKTGATFNSCLLNLYHDGEEGMGWHSDDEKTLGKNTAIASITLGAERKFSFKHKQTQEIVSLLLENGSLLVMKDATQTHWLHRLPPATKIKTARINLTFRTMVS
ncbi:MAG: alpha-ketoglutarate-dependent dioxygenase AlkB [Ferruginibacter sp.]|nr:alpha-ketoglutarate-dependent dioxygenase AlkB [Ferruginibacter sp.]